MALSNNNGLEVIELSCRIGAAFSCFSIPLWTSLHILEEPILGTSCVRQIGFHTPPLDLHEERLTQAWKTIRIKVPSGKDPLLRLSDP